MNHVLKVFHDCRGLSTLTEGAPNKNQCRIKETETLLFPREEI